MHETSKAVKRRYNLGNFHRRYFVGDGIDIGSGPDSLARYGGFFPGVRSLRSWDVAQGDAQYLNAIPDASFDFVHSSHCLEHMVDVRVALQNWIRITKPGGFLIITVPDETLYEKGNWPSRFNSDHKWSFTLWKREQPLPKSINVLELLLEFGHHVDVEKVEVIMDFYAPAEADLTMNLVSECAIEMILRRKN